MKPNEQVVGEAVRVEYEEKSGELYIVFKITDEQYKHTLKRDWTKDIEFRVIDKLLVKENE